MEQRNNILALIAAEIDGLTVPAITFVGIDGVDGAGKTMFADELARQFGDGVVIRASVDGFHNPRKKRYAQGKDSPRGFFEDSYNYPILQQLLLDPLRASSPMRHCCAYFDHRSDSEVDLDWKDAPQSGVLIVDGIFLHRPELVDYWDYSIFLEVSRLESLQRGIDRDGSKGAKADLSDPVHRRYIEFVIVYLGGDQPSSPEEGEQHFAKYMEWLSSLGDAVISPANPLKNTSTINPDGSVTSGGATAMSGYTIIEADSMDAALTIAQACPFLDIGGSLEVSELLEMPGQK
jgi:uridine kinase